jgi:two-component system response regulator
MDAQFVAIADDDRDDQDLVRDAFEESGMKNRLEFFDDGAALLEFLRSPALVRLPALILLDLNMPRLDGRKTLRQIRADARLKHLPVVVLTTANGVDAVMDIYREGANSFIAKPTQFSEMVDVVHSLSKFWFDVAVLPRLH